MRVIEYTVNKSGKITHHLNYVSDEFPEYTSFIYIENSIIVLMIGCCIIAYIIKGHSQYDVDGQSPEFMAFIKKMYDVSYVPQQQYELYDDLKFCHEQKLGQLTETICAL